MTQLRYIQHTVGTKVYPNSVHIMSSPCRIAARSCTRSIRAQSSFRPSTSFIQRRCESTGAAVSTNPKIAGIVDQISQLTLLETADLVTTLKVGCEHYICTCLPLCCLQLLLNPCHLPIFSCKLKPHDHYDFGTNEMHSNASTSLICPWEDSPPQLLRRLLS